MPQNQQYWKIPRQDADFKKDLLARLGYHLSGEFPPDQEGKIRRNIVKDGILVGSYISSNNTLEVKYLDAIRDSKGLETILNLITVLDKNRINYTIVVSDEIITALKAYSIFTNKLLEKVSPTTPIDSVKWRPTTMDTFAKLGITTFEELAEKYEDELVLQKNFSYKSLEQVKKRLKEKGLKLKGLAKPLKPSREFPDL